MVIEAIRLFFPSHILFYCRALEDGTTPPLKTPLSFFFIFLS